MKTFLILTLFSSLFLLTSCSKDDFTKAKNLKGTQWKSEDKFGGHYYLLKFPGNSSYEIHEFEPGEGLGLLEEGSFAIDEKIIVLHSDEGDTGRLTIDGDNITWANFYSEYEIFTKQ